MTPTPLANVAHVVPDTDVVDHHTDQLHEARPYPTCPCAPRIEAIDAAGAVLPLYAPRALVVGFVIVHDRLAARRPPEPVLP